METLAGSRSRFSRAAAFFHRHPVLLLLAFTPGIPEYLSGSSVLWPLLVAPGGVLLFLALNLGLYGPGVLLLREAWVRRGKGWGALLCFGAAYGLLEEGTALSTLFNPHASVVHALGHYGRYAGTNWVWLVGVLGVHIVYSVGLPILLLGLALPETRGRSLLSRRGIGVAGLVYVLDIAALAAAIGYWRVELAWLLGAAGVALLLWAVAFRLPAGWLDPPLERPRRAPAVFFLGGLALFPLLLLVPGVVEAAGAPAALAFVLELAVAAALFLAVRQGIGRRANEPHLVLLALGATLPLAAAGLLAQLFLPVVLVVDVLYALFFYALWQHYRPLGGVTVPSGVLGG
jgi:hypothetical protein